VTALKTSHPPAPSQEVNRWVLDNFAELRSLRSSLYRAITGEALPDGGFLDEVPEKMAVVATELATNALAHARPPTLVQLRRTDTTFILDVADDDPDAFPELSVDRAPGAGGLGMQFVRDLSGDYGWYVDDEVKHVWAQFPIPHV
jgi:serine/threonine-protein kinase RsbW